MLSPSEFTVGKVGNARPLSLILPIKKNEETLLIGQFNGTVVATFLSGQHKSLFFESEGNTSWGGLIIPNVRIEVDETSVVDPHRADAPPLSVTRIDTRFVVTAKCERPFGDSKLVTLHDNLESAGEFQAAFTKWQIVVGEIQNKRTIWSSA